MRAAVALVIACSWLFACKREEPQAQSGIVVDSIFPIGVEIARFKQARGISQVDGLSGGARSRDRLVARFEAAIASRDTVGLRDLVLSAGEFIDIYYPGSVHSRPPYKQSPEVVWFLMQQNSEKGIKRVLERYGGRQLPLSTKRLFGEIIERDGTFKFVSYANDL